MPYMMHLTLCKYLKINWFKLQMKNEGISSDIHNPFHYQIIFKVSYVCRPCLHLRRRLEFILIATALLKPRQPVTQNWPLTL